MAPFARRRLYTLPMSRPVKTPPATWPSLADYAAYAELGAPLGRTSVAVVTVLLNAVDTVSQTLASVHAEPMPVRHVIVDGGSTDGTAAYVAKHKRAGDLLISEPDRGISDAMNKGIAASNSDYVAIIHGDDALGPGQLQTALAAARAGDLDAVFGSVRMSRGGRFWYLWRGQPDYAAVLPRRMPAVPHPSLLISRRAFERAGLYSLRYKLAMDYEWLLRAHRLGVNATFVEGVVADMNHDGRSNTAYAKTLAEVADIVQSYGRPRLIAQAERFGRVFKTAVSMKAQRGAPQLHALLRRAVNRDVSFGPTG